MDSIFKPTLRLIAGRALGFCGAFLIPIVLVRVFSPAEFGTYKQLLLLYSTLYLVVPFGMAESLYYFIPRQPQQTGAYVANATLFIGAAALLGLALAGTLGLAGATVAPHLPALGVFTALMLVSATLEIVMVSRKEYLPAARTYAASDLVRAGLFTIPAAMTGRIEWLLGGAILFAAIRLVMALVYMTRALGGSLRPDLSALRAQLAYALPFGGAALLEIAQSTYHQYVVSYQYSAAAFALYSVGCLQISVVDFLAGPAGNVTMVRMGELRDDRAEVLRLWHETTRKLALVFVPMVVLLEVVSFDLITFLFTPLYAPSVPIFRIWSTMILLSAFQTDAVLRVYARTRFLFVLNLLRLVLIAATIGPALRLLGLPGAALVTVATLFVTKGLALARLRPLLGARVSTLAPWGALARITGVAAASALPALLFHAGTSEGTFARLFVASILYAATYTVLTVAVLLSADERQALTALFTQRVPRPATDGVGAGS